MRFERFSELWDKAGCNGIGYVICLFLITLPLGIWKFIEIVIWLINHVHITLR